MRLFQTAVIALAAASSAWAAADPKLLGLLMPDAQMIAGVHLGQAKASPFGQFVLSQTGPAAELDKLKAATGFDPRTDMTEMVAGSALTGAGLVAGHGSFQAARLTAFATTSGAKTENYRGITLVSSGELAVAFLDGTTVILGPPAVAKGAIDRWLSGPSSSALAAKAAQVSSSSHAWAVAAGFASLLGSGAPNTPEAQMAQNVASKISQVSAGMNFADTITMRADAQATSSQDAQALADVLRFVVAMSADKAPLPVTPQVTSTGDTVSLVMTLTQQQAEKLFPARR